MDSNHKPAKTLSDRFAYGLVKLFRFFADAFFRKRYGHRAVVLETVAAVPGMVGAALLHFRCLRKIKDDEGWIKTLLNEADNERVHLMTFIFVAQPNILERSLIFCAQILFVMMYLLMYVVSTRTAHRFVGYLEEEAVVSYTHYLKEIDSGKIENIPAPELAKLYWHLPKDARLRDVVIAVRKDEMEHRDTNHHLSDQLSAGHSILTSPKPFNRKNQ